MYIHVYIHVYMLFSVFACFHRVHTCMHIHVHIDLSHRSPKMKEDMCTVLLKVLQLCMQLHSTVISLMILG